MTEIWRNIIGYEGLYQVSNWGRVKSLNYNHTGQERVLKPVDSGKGYLVVNLSKDGKQKCFLVHRLVGMAFPDMVGWTEKAKGKPFDELEINHKDQNKQNNFVYVGEDGSADFSKSNLEWCDGPYNLEYGDARERQAKALTNGKTSKPVAQKTKDGELVKIWPSIHEIERQTGWSQAHICKCCTGKRQHAYGHCWSYAPQENT